MTTPDADDASPSPEYRSDLDDENDMAADQKTDDGSPDQKPNGQKANAKDPMRPRRKKARRACFACQRAHLTCGDERPCNRCIKRNLADHCMDGVRKKAKYLHDAPEGALMPGVGGHYPYMNGNRPTPLPSQDTQTVSVSPQGNIYTQAPSGTFYPPPSAPIPLPPTQEGQTFNNQQSPISPPFTQAHHGQAVTTPSSMSQGQSNQMQQFGPLFDPSDPALFNFDISSLNFGNHYGALEFGMLGHMSSGAVDAPHDNGMMNAMNQNPNMYGPQMTGGYPGPANPSGGLSFGPNGHPTGEWHESQSRQGSMHVHTPNNTPATATLDQNGNRHDSLNGPHAFAIGQGPASHSTASPASTDASAFESENPMSTATFFANTNRTQPQRSPTLTRQNDNRQRSSALQPIHSNGIRKRNRDTKSIYEGIRKPYDYVKGYHRLFLTCHKKFDKVGLAQAQEYLTNYRPVLVSVHGDMDTADLVHQERGLQRNLMTLEEHFEQVGTPFLICRRSGEVVGCNKEFTILTGWRKEVLLGHQPNLNVNLGNSRGADESELSTQTNTTPNLTGQEPDPGAQAVNVVQLMDAKGALKYLEKFSELCWQDPHGHAKQRTNMLRYQTKADFDRIQEMKANSDHKDIVKMEGGAVHQGESAMQRLGAKNGMVDCMIWWHIKRDTFEMPLLVCMSVMPVLDKALH
ncbi:transcription activator of gluconeogenesis [Paraphoma chrysanthemicola]|uniref:Transcription activator of gluconeogenesis n=1 Tax=Paraphoma chrysanthemicola TaxID=798071 RepID=A0A8K0QWU7_9PLEO|nr:transcription activator of gluconeogenesis [Paraphoma chrysanthemicola]